MIDLGTPVNNIPKNPEQIEPLLVPTESPVLGKTIPSSNPTNTNIINDSSLNERTIDNYKFSTINYQHPAKYFYEEKSSSLCGSIEQLNPFIVAYEAFLEGDEVWSDNSKNPYISALWDEMGYDSREFPTKTTWSALFVGACLKRSGNKYIQTASTLAYSWYGKEILLSDMRQGDIAVFSRYGINSGFGHVGFLTGSRVGDTIDVLGGNQGDSLTIKRFDIFNKINNWELLTIRRPVSCLDGKTFPPYSLINPYK